jgi:ATP-dependent DNA ligase
LIEIAWGKQRIMEVYLNVVEWAPGIYGAEAAGLQPLATAKMPLEVSPPHSSRFGSPLVLSRVHWVRPELVAEVKFLTWTGDNLLRQVVYQGLREDKPAAEVRREVPHAKPEQP